MGGGGGFMGEEQDAPELTPYSGTAHPSTFSLMTDATFNDDARLYPIVMQGRRCVGRGAGYSVRWASVRKPWDQDRWRSLGDFNVSVSGTMTCASVSRSLMRNYR